VLSGIALNRRSPCAHLALGRSVTDTLVFAIFIWRNLDLAEGATTSIALEALPQAHQNVHIKAWAGRVCRLTEHIIRNLRLKLLDVVTEPRFPQSHSTTKPIQTGPRTASLVTVPGELGQAA